MKKLLMRVPVLIVGIFMVAVFSLGGCAPAVESVVGEPEAVVEEPEEEPDEPANNEQKDISFEPISSLQDLLEAVSPDEPLEYTLNERFSLDNSLIGLEYFRELGFSAIEDLNMDFEVYMGFTNCTGAVEGTLRKQNYDIKRLELELARLKYISGEIDDQELAQKEQAFESAKEDFKAFWKSFYIMD